MLNEEFICLLFAVDISACNCIGNQKLFLKAYIVTKDAIILFHVILKKDMLKKFAQH